MNEAERKAALDVWASVLSLLVSGTPTDGMKTICRNNIRALKERKSS